MRTGKDDLVLGDLIFEKSEQPHWYEPEQTFELDP